jgi:hypothetical protein
VCSSATLSTIKLHQHNTLRVILTRARMLSRTHQLNVRRQHPKTSLRNSGNTLRVRTLQFNSRFISCARIEENVLKKIRRCCSVENVRLESRNPAKPRSINPGGLRPAPPTPPGQSDPPSPSKSIVFFSRPPKKSQSGAPIDQSRPKTKRTA